MMEYGESNNMKKVRNIDKDKWYLCTRPNKIRSRKGVERDRPLTAYEMNNAELIPILLSVQGKHIINLKQKGMENSYHNGCGERFEHYYAGIIVVTEIPCYNKSTARKMINKNREKCIMWCNKEIENFEIQYKKLNEQMNKDGFSDDEKYKKRNEFYKKLIY